MKSYKVTKSVTDIKFCKNSKEIEWKNYNGKETIKFTKNLNIIGSISRTLTNIIIQNNFIIFLFSYKIFNFLVKLVLCKRSGKLDTRPIPTKSSCLRRSKSDCLFKKRKFS